MVAAASRFGGMLPSDFLSPVASSDLALLRRSEALATPAEITIDNPPANAIGKEVSKGLSKAFATLRDDPSVDLGVVVEDDARVQQAVRVEQVLDPLHQRVGIGTGYADVVDHQVVASGVEGFRNLGEAANGVESVIRAGEVQDLRRTPRWRPPVAGPID